jgi:hypothetical protein
MKTDAAAMIDRWNRVFREQSRGAIRARPPLAVDLKGAADRVVGSAIVRRSRLRA